MTIQSTLGHGLLRLVWGSAGVERVKGMSGAVDAEGRCGEKAPVLLQTQPQSWRRSSQDLRCPLATPPLSSL